MTIAIALFALFGLFAASVIRASLRQAMPALQELRCLLAQAKAPVAVRFTITEIRRAEIPALAGRLRNAGPVRARPAAAKPPRTLRPVTGVAA